MVILKTPTPTIPREPWLQKWLNNPTCQPPCWENITAGSTTFDEAVNILNNLPDVVPDGPLKSEYGNQYSIWWEFSENNSGGELLTGANSPRVMLIDLALDSNQILTTNEIIQIYGEPDHVLVRECAPNLHCTVHLIYDEGFAVSLFLKSRNGSISIASDSVITDIWFFPPGIDSYIKALPIDSERINIAASLMEWEGFTKYKYPSVMN
jgi:hypothetical protein